MSTPKTVIASIISGTGKAIRTSNLAGTFAGSIELKPIQNFGEKGAWTYPSLPGTARIFEYSLLSQERVKLRASNFVRTFMGSIGTKAH